MNELSTFRYKCRVFLCMYRQCIKSDLWPWPVDCLDLDYNDMLLKRLECFYWGEKKKHCVANGCADLVKLFKVIHKEERITKTDISDVDIK